MLMQQHQKFIWKLTYQHLLETHQANTIKRSNATLFLCISQDKKVSHVTEKGLSDGANRLRVWYQRAYPV